MIETTGNRIKLWTLSCALLLTLASCNPFTTISGNEANVMLKQADLEGIVLCSIIHPGQLPFILELDPVKATARYDRAEVQKCADDRRMMGAVSPMCGLIFSSCKPSPLP